MHLTSTRGRALGSCMIGLAGLLLGLATSPAQSVTASPVSAALGSSVARSARASAMEDGLYLERDPRDVDVLSPTDAWEVGGKRTPRSSGLVRHWDGTAWVHQPKPSVPAAEFEGVKAFGKNDVWAVGSWQGTQGDGFPDALVEHWDGKRWRQSGCFDPYGFSTLNDIDGLAPNDLWAVGVRSDVADPLIEHWDGTSWRVATVHIPPGEGNAGFLFGVRVIAPDNVYAVGMVQLSGQLEPMIEHWDGKTWSRQQVSLPTFSVLLDVDASSPTDVWAAGYVGYRSGQLGKDHARVVHFNGTGWTTSLALDGDRNTYLSGVVALSPSDVWAAGARWDPKPASQAESWHWDGDHWTRVGAPAVGHLSNSFEAISGLSSGDLVAVGTYDVPHGSDYYTRPLAEQWDGTAWTVMP